MASRHPLYLKPGGVWVTRAIILLVLLGMALPIHAGNSNSEKERTLKAAFVYNFIRYVSWPDTNESALDPDHLLISVVGEDEMWFDFPELESRMTKAGKPIRIEQATLIDKQALPHIVLITTDDKSVLARVLTQLAASPTLTVSHSADFAKLGTMINFFVVETESGTRKVKFEINQHSVAKSNLKISAHLLNLARLVEAEVDSR